ncbi:Tight junction protein ZO-1 [Bagarius yarrelli]|uniref:Tight junction protein ZO-1 n=1 Tax=Bagarius yarrelli TaxID=175774 RepID=A0A556V3I6_BAGYA|nr:Tight junction protein ZO-1 [Bagarius yarrelli]
MVNAVSMDNVEHAYAVQQLRKSGKNAKITIRRKRKVQIPAARAGDRETMSEREEDTEEEEFAGSGAKASTGTSRRNDRSASLGRREQSVSPRSDRRSVTSAGPPRPSKVTLVKSRKSEGKLKMVVQRDERATLLNVPDVDDSIPSGNSERDDISEIHSITSDHSHDQLRSTRSRSPDKRSDPSDISGQSPQQINGRPSMKLVKFRKGESVGLRLAGGNDVGIFVAGVVEDTPAAKEGLEEGDQILRHVLNRTVQRRLSDWKVKVYRRIVESDVGDSFYIRTHFEYEKESPYGLSFNKGEVFRVVDTLCNGKLGSWLAIRIGKNHQEVERGIIPNKNRAEQLSSVQYTLPKTPGGDRADFWRFRGLRSSKRNLRKSREDLTAQPVQTKFPAYERVVLREESEPRDAGTDQHRSGIIRLHTIKQIIDRWYPIVVFLNPDSKQGVKNMRTRLCPESKKSARKLYERALKLRKNNHHLFTGQQTTLHLP